MGIKTGSVSLAQCIFGAVLEGNMKDKRIP